MDGALPPRRKVPAASPRLRVTWWGLTLWRPSAVFLEGLRVCALAQTRHAAPASPTPTHVEVAFQPETQATSLLVTRACNLDVASTTGGFGVP